MPTKKNKVEVEISAVDEATPKIDRLEKKIDGLESDEARIIVSANTERLEQQLNKARGDLDGLEGDELTVKARMVGNLETELEQARALLRELDGKTGTVRITARDQASADLERVSDKVRELDGEIADVGTTAERSAGIGAAAGKVAGVAAIGAAVTKALDDTIELNREIERVADSTGAPREEANRLIAVWKQNGQEVADLEDLLGNVNQVLADTPELADQLDVRNATDLIDQFLQVAKGIDANISDPFERARVRAQLFGEEGKRQIDALLSAGGDLETQMDQVSDRQLISDEDNERLQKANEQLIEFKGHLTEIEVFIATNLLPIINDVAEGIKTWFTDWVPSAGQAVAGAGGDVRRFLLGDANDPNPGMQTVIQRNTGGFIGGASIGGMGGSLTAGPAGAAGASVTIVNPPGTPPTVVDATRLYGQRNGAR